MSVSDLAVAPWRLNALRAAYLLLAAGLGVQIWPVILGDHAGWALMEGVVQCMLGAMALLSVIGLFHPLKMLPLLLFEIAWKVIWLSAVAAPRWAEGRMDAATLSVTFACLLVVIFPIVIPWPYVFSTFARTPAERWR